MDSESEDNCWSTQPGAGGGFLPSVPGEVLRRVWLCSRSRPDMLIAFFGFVFFMPRPRWRPLAGGRVIPFGVLRVSFRRTFDWRRFEGVPSSLSL